MTTVEAATTFGRVRAHWAGLINDATPADVSVVDYLPDGVSAPAVLLGWGDPWLDPDTQILCGEVTARMDAWLIAGRFEPGGALDVLELLVTQVWSTLGDAYTFAGLTAPYPLEIGGVTYLAARLSVDAEVEI